MNAGEFTMKTGYEETSPEIRIFLNENRVFFPWQIEIYDENRRINHGKKRI